MSANNMAAMREALEKLVAHLDKEVALTKKCNTCMYKEGCRSHAIGALIEDYERKASDAAKFLLNKFKLRAALSAPPRNCDVGTAEEQIERFREFCKAEKCGRYRCGSGSKSICIDRCAIAWAQMPYEAEEGGVE